MCVLFWKSVGHHSIRFTLISAVSLSFLFISSAVCISSSSCDGITFSAFVWTTLSGRPWPRHRHSNPSVLCNFACVCVCNSLSFRLCERISRMYTSITHTWLQRRSSLSHWFGVWIFILFVVASNVPCHHYRHRHLRFHCLFSCRLSASNAEEQTTIFSTFSVFFFFGIAPLESHADIYRRRQLMFRLLFFIFFNLYCPDWVSAFRVCTNRNEFEKNDLKKGFSLSLECSAIIKPSGTLVNYTVHPEKPERAPNFYDFKMSFKKWCVFFSITTIYLDYL